MMKTLSVKLPEPLATWLASESKATRRSRSQLVREALEAKRMGYSKGKRVTMAEALDSLGGTIRGPRDLATNPKHFNGFGA